MAPQLEATIKPISECDDSIIWIRYDDDFDADNYYMHDLEDGNPDDEPFVEEIEEDWDREEVPVAVTEEEEDWDKDDENQEEPIRQENQNVPNS